MSKQYEILKLSDFLGIPDDKLDDCLADFRHAIHMSKGMYHLLHAATEVVTGEPIQVPEYPAGAFPKFTWIDDGKIGGTMHIKANGETLATFTTEIKSN